MLIPMIGGRFDGAQYDTAKNKVVGSTTRPKPTAPRTQSIYEKRNVFGGWRYVYVFTRSDDSSSSSSSSTGSGDSDSPISV